MLMPKKVKHRKTHRGGKIRGKATRGNSVSFGSFGLKAMECAWQALGEVYGSAI